MQISVDSIMNGEHPHYRINNFHIYLNGELQKKVVALDTLGTLHNKDGWVESYTDVIMNGEVLTEIVYGNVEIKLRTDV